MTLVRKWRQTSTRRATDLAWCAGHRSVHTCGPLWDSPPPVSIGMEARSGLGDQQAWRQARAKKAQEGSNFQAVDARIPMGSGFAWITNADSHDLDQIPTLQFKKRQPFSQITIYGWQMWGLFVPIVPTLAFSIH